MIPSGTHFLKMSAFLASALKDSGHSQWWGMTNLQHDSDKGASGKWWTPKKNCSLISWHQSLVIIHIVQEWNSKMKLWNKTTNNSLKNTQIKCMPTEKGRVFPKYKYWHLRRMNWWRDEAERKMPAQAVQRKVQWPPPACPPFLFKAGLQLSVHATLGQICPEREGSLSTAP